ncbi:MAG TPA: hypothetical protein VIL39_04235 [Verrucomicrobiae bacterium]
MREEPRAPTRPDKCPRLSWLPPAKQGVIDITVPYFQKHGAYIQEHGVWLEGKRISKKLPVSLRMPNP